MAKFFLSIFISTFFVSSYGMNSASSSAAVINLLNPSNNDILTIPLPLPSAAVDQQEIPHIDLTIEDEQNRSEKPSATEKTILNATQKVKERLDSQGNTYGRYYTGNSYVSRKKKYSFLTPQQPQQLPQKSQQPQESQQVNQYLKLNMASDANRTCSICGKILPTIRGLTSHKRVHT